MKNKRSPQLAALIVVISFLAGCRSQPDKAAFEVSNVTTVGTTRTYGSLKPSLSFHTSADVSVTSKELKQKNIMLWLKLNREYKLKNGAIETKEVDAAVLIKDGHGVVTDYDHYSDLPEDGRETTGPTYTWTVRGWVLLNEGNLSISNTTASFTTETKTPSDP